MSLPADSRRRMLLPATSQRHQLPLSHRFEWSACAQVEDSISVSEPCADPEGTGTYMLSIPQAQVACRYKDLARVLKKRGLSAEAKAAWIHALDLLTLVASLHPELPEVQRRRCECANDLAWFLINERDPAVADSQLAVSLAVQATQANPKVAAYWNTLGAAYYRAGSHPDAIAALERSIALSGEGTGFDYVFLALAHARLGQYEQAHQWNTQADIWMGKNGSHLFELTRHHAQARAYLTSKVFPTANLMRRSSEATLESAGAARSSSNDTEL